MSGCSLSAPSTTIQSQTGSAKTVFVEAEKFVKQTYPQAILVAYNNHAANSYRLSAVPSTDTVNGQSSVWYFLFARTPETLTDKSIADADLVAVEFKKGTLTLLESATMQEYDLSDTSTTGANLLNTDSDAVLQKAVGAIGQQLGSPVTAYAVDWKALPAFAEVSVFTSATEGYMANFDYKTGEVSAVRDFSFGSY